MAGLLFFLLFSAAASLLLGRYPSPGFMNPAILFDDPLAMNLVLHLRLPRVLTAIVLGMSLAGGGAVFQALFANPLVEPGFLGVSQGAAFGAALILVLVGEVRLAVQLGAAGAALLGLILSVWLARQIRYGGWILRLLLSGIAVSAFFSAGLGIIKFLADPLKQLPDITFWLLGGLWAVTWPDFISILPAAVPGLLIPYLMRWRLNVLSLDEKVAHSLGAAPGLERMVLLISVTAATGAVVSVAGIVGWIGLITPHLARRLFRSDGTYAVPASMLLGGIFALICDDVSRTLIAGEIPLGILTSFFGALGFLLLFTRSNLAKPGVSRG